MLDQCGQVISEYQEMKADFEERHIEHDRALAMQQVAYDSEIRDLDTTCCEAQERKPLSSYQMRTENFNRGSP